MVKFSGTDHFAALPGMNTDLLAFDDWNGLSDGLTPADGTFSRLATMKRSLTVDSDRYCDAQFEQ